MRISHFDELSLPTATQERQIIPNQDKSSRQEIEYGEGKDPAGRQVQDERHPKG